MLPNPAIFQKQDILKEAQRGILRPVAFGPYLTMGLALYRKDLSSQQDIHIAGTSDML